MAQNAYVYDQSWSEERTRLAGLEALWDEGTHAVLQRAGARLGASVLEVGAGGGSIVGWLAAQVGESGRVVAVDIDTRFVEPLASASVEIRRLDVVNDDLPSAEFDVVHARLLLEHLPARDAVLDKLVGALKPGGCLVVEDYDWSPFGFQPSSGLERRAAEGIIGFMTLAGFVADYGRALPQAFADRGLTDVTGEGRVRVIESGHPGAAFFRLSFDQLAPAAVQAGTLSAEDAAAFPALLDTADYRVITPMLLAATGRRRD